MVVLATSVTATTRVLAVLADTTVTVGHVTAMLTCVLKTCRLQNEEQAVSTLPEP